MTLFFGVADAGVDVVVVDDFWKKRSGLVLKSANLLFASLRHMHRHAPTSRLRPAISFQLRAQLAAMAHNALAHRVRSVGLDNRDSLAGAAPQVTFASRGGEAVNGREIHTSLGFVSAIWL